MVSGVPARRFHRVSTRIIGQRIALGETYDFLAAGTVAIIDIQEGARVIQEFQTFA